MKFSEMPYKRVTWEEIRETMQGHIWAFTQAEDGEGQYQAYRKAMEDMDRFETQMTLASIRNDIHMEDSFYEEEQKYYDEIRPLINNETQKLAALVVSSPYRDVFVQKLGRMAVANMDMFQRSYHEKIVDLVQEENALISRYDKLIASARIDWEGEILNLSLLRKYMTDPDQEVRRRACRKMSAFLASISDEVDEIYDQMVKNRTEQAKRLGFDNYIPLGYLRMNRSCYGQKQVEEFRRQVKEHIVPLAERLHEERRKDLGVSHLYYCDELVHFAQGDPKPMGTPEEILANGIRMYEELSPETSEFIHFMMENELFDVLGYKDKKAGGYMTFLPVYQSPFVFANFNGTSGDTDVLTHECGHAFQGYLQRKGMPAERDLTMETAEIHSMSMEFFTEPWMKLFYGDRADDYIKMHLMEAICFIPYGCMVDEFQHIVYANPDMSPKERKAVWSMLEKEYKPHLDYEGDDFLENGGYWQRQGHIFQVPFYYIDYCLAQSCALAFKVKMDEDYKGAWRQYLRLCQAGGKDFVEALAIAELPNPLEAGVLERIVGGLEK